MSPPPTPAKPRILLMYGSGGGGHKATAQAIAAHLHAVYPPHLPHAPSVILVDAAAISGASAGDALYNLLLTRNAVAAIDLMHSAIQLLWPLAVPSLRAHFRAFFASHLPALACVVSLVPMLNAVFADTLPPALPFFTVLTDFSHTPAHPWIQHPRQHLVVGTALALAQARARGYLPPALPGPAMRVSCTSGMVVHPRFYHAPSAAVRARRAAHLGLNPAHPTVLILFGAAPPTRPVLHLVERYAACARAHPRNLIVVCSRNAQLLQRLQRRRSRFPHQHLHLTAFTAEIPLLMYLADVLVGKPGPGVVSEAFVTGVPCVLLGGGVMQQERDVADWVRAGGVGIVADTPDEVVAVDREKIDSMRARIRSQQPNRAVFEVGDLILGSLGYPAKATQGMKEEEAEDEAADEAEDEENEEEEAAAATATVAAHGRDGRRRTQEGRLEEPRSVDISEALPGEDVAGRVSAVSLRGETHDAWREEEEVDVQQFAMPRHHSLSPRTITARPRGEAGGREGLYSLDKAAREGEGDL